jgi:hypothetical protein
MELYPKKNRKKEWIAKKSAAAKVKEADLAEQSAAKVFESQEKKSVDGLSPEILAKLKATKINVLGLHCCHQGVGLWP